MERVEYERMHAVEDRMWWYRGLRTLVAELFARALSRSPGAGPVLDAGCGTVVGRLQRGPLQAHQDEQHSEDKRCGGDRGQRRETPPPAALIRMWWSLRREERVEMWKSTKRIPTFPQRIVNCS